MALLKWSDDYSVKVVEIDKQHQKLFTLINDLYDAMLARKTKEVMGKILEELKTYTVVHFSKEEKYFEKFSYPAINSHIKEHESFVAKVVEFQKGFESGKLFLSTEITTFLKEWLSHHIKVIDKQYSMFLNSKGIK